MYSSTRLILFANHVKLLALFYYYNINHLSNVFIRTGLMYPLAGVTSKHTVVCFPFSSMFHVKHLCRFYTVKMSKTFCLLLSKLSILLRTHNLFNIYFSHFL